MSLPLPTPNSQAFIGWSTRLVWWYAENPPLQDDVPIPEMLLRQYHFHAGTGASAAAAPASVPIILIPAPVPSEETYKAEDDSDVPDVDHVVDISAVVPPDLRISQVPDANILVPDEGPFKLATYSYYHAALTASMPWRCCYVNVSLFLVTWDSR
ncbi:hypothetical protein THASP1DRAFT_25213 [Thamnocephalis sphaerospora]|uniref:Uncharacterized protein n=1 Tax=Thamnocephalis sphaerospora TaxID=78915 RepID=A0A4P9XMI0_9FUNG|nr:hypothetical protein THASP1DRAFT_25213 [Thamnocephalis sphaerospora]|eukprot:RKP06470.1 hypothetical protein THASP1DRAFT_25213 [Thamnocephalis sphaerospora]